MRILRKPVLLQCVGILAFSAQAAFANVGVNVNINLGEPQRQVVVAPPPPAYVAPPAYAPPAEPIRVDEDIQFVYPDALGFYVAVGVPYDLFYLQNSYFLFRDGRWFRAPSSRGPWLEQGPRNLPQVLRRQRLERIREYRTREYMIYNRDREHYRGKHFRSEKEQWKGRQKEVKERRKEEKWLEKDQRKEEKRVEKDQRKDEKRVEKEEHRDHREGRD
jgi:hypothetical protein